MLRLRYHSSSCCCSVTVGEKAEGRKRPKSNFKIIAFDPGVAQHTGEEPAGRRGKKAERAYALMGLWLMNNFGLDARRQIRSRQTCDLLTQSSRWLHDQLTTDDSRFTHSQLTTLTTHNSQFTIHQNNSLSHTCARSVSKASFLVQDPWQI